MSLRKLSLWTMVGILVLAVSACTPAAQSAPSTNTPAVEQPTEAATEIPAEQPTEAATEVPADTATETPAEQPTEAPTEQPTAAAPTEAGGLEGTKWMLTAVGDHPLVNTAVRPNLELAAGGTFRGFAGCNSFVGQYELGDGTITFATPTIGYRECESAGVMEQEQAFVAALASATGYILNGDTLSIQTSEGTLAFERAGRE